MSQRHCEEGEHGSGFFFSQLTLPMLVETRRIAGGRHFVTNDSQISSEKNELYATLSCLLSSLFTTWTTSIAYVSNGTQ